MITLEAIATAAPLKKLVEGKALMKVGLVNRGLKINKNIAQELVTQGLIRSMSPEGPPFYTLTSKGQETLNQLEYREVEVPFDLFLRLEREEDIVENLLEHRFTLWKLMVNTCVSCKKEVRHALNLVEDAQGNRGAYCDECLRDYDKALKQMTLNRKEARY